MAKLVDVGEPFFTHRRRHVSLIHELDQDLTAAVEVAPHDPVAHVGVAHPAAAVVDVGPEEASRELELSAGEDHRVHVPEVEADHGVLADPKHELVDERTERLLSAHGLIGRHRREATMVPWTRPSKRDSVPPVPVREARPDDVDTLVEGNRAMAQETEALELDLEQLRSGVKAVFDEPSRGRYWLDEVAGRVRGQLLVTYEWSDWRAANVWWIQSVYVWPNHRRQGVFRRLYGHVEREARAGCAAGLRLYVDHSNALAQKVYARLGMDGDHYQLFESMFR